MKFDIRGVGLLVWHYDSESLRCTSSKICYQMTITNKRIMHGEIRRLNYYVEIDEAYKKTHRRNSRGDRGGGDGPPKLRRVVYSSLYLPQNCRHLAGMLSPPPPPQLLTQNCATGKAMARARDRVGGSGCFRI